LTLDKSCLYFLGYASHMTSHAVRSRLAALVLLAVSIVSLAISPFSNIDPINLIKVLALSSLGFASIPLVLWLAKNKFSQLSPVLIFTSIAFFLWMVIVFLVSGAPLNQQFWGVFGRNTGFLTYISLLLVLLGSAVVQHKDFYRKLVHALVIVSISVLIYATIQFLGRDPISWSQMAPFGTFGNINFSSAFFGMSAVAMSTLAIQHGMHLLWRLTLIAIVAFKIFLIGSTGSIQGILIFLAGCSVVFFFFIISHQRLKRLKFPYLALALAGLGLAIAGLLNSGPLARFIFGETVLFRYDYWYAGWMMTLRNPLFGVGLDSYGDWYRQLRGEVATLRTVPDRITNSAHNIYLDISSGGGLPLLLFYLMILVIAGKSAIESLKRAEAFDPILTALTAVWVAYLVQAAISINQVGVGVWGWAFTGALIGYARVRNSSETRSKKLQSHATKNLGESNQMPISVSLMSLAAFAIGFVLAFIPFRADSEFRTAQESGSLSSMVSAATSLGSTAYHLEISLDSAVQSNDITQADAITEELLRRYPRDFMAWRVRQVLTNSTPEEREEAYQMLRELDPYNPEVQRTP
jgi:O-antigen ligase